MKLIWEKSGECYFSAAHDSGGTIVWHLVVEPIPGEGWDWTIWRPGDLPGTTVRGAAKTVHEAMWTAEQMTLPSRSE